MKALITGITGQDGSYLAELLLEKGYEVHGLVRRAALENPKQRMGRIAHIRDRLSLHKGDVTSFASVFAVIESVRPESCYHLAAQSDVAHSFGSPFETMRVNVDGTHHVLEALRVLAPRCRFYFAGSSEMFGHVDKGPQNEDTPFHPRSPYGISKVAGFNLTRMYREAYHMHCSSGILFNHESPRRGYEFVTRKITSAVARFAAQGGTGKLQLGNMQAYRDWGFAGDYVEAMWRMVQRPLGDDFVIATGETHSVQELACVAFHVVRLRWSDFVEVDASLYRPADVHSLWGDATRAEKVLMWKPRVKFHQLVEMMVKADMELLQGGGLL